MPVCPVCSNSARLNAMSPDCDIRTSLCLLKCLKEIRKFRISHITDIIFILVTLNCYKVSFYRIYELISGKTPGRKNVLAEVNQSI